VAPFRPSRPKRRVWPTVLRIVALWSVVAICGIPSASAQFLYLDSNGDGVSSEADVLNPAGEPTNITIYLDTSHNPDSSAAVCGTGQE
jgi:hypothetical protein